jgi:hypothetical protein
MVWVDMMEWPEVLLTSVFLEAQQFWLVCASQFITGDLVSTMFTPSSAKCSLVKAARGSGCAPKIASILAVVQD